MKIAYLSNKNCNLELLVKEIVGCYAIEKRKVPYHVRNFLREVKKGTKEFFDIYYLRHVFGNIRTLICSSDNKLVNDAIFNIEVAYQSIHGLNENNWNTEESLIGWKSEYYFSLPIDDNLYILINDEVSSLSNYLYKLGIKENEGYSCVTGVRYATKYLSANIDKNLLPFVFRINFKGDFTKKEINPFAFIPEHFSDNEKDIIKKVCVKDLVSSNQKFNPLVFESFDVSKCVH